MDSGVKMEWSKKFSRKKVADELEQKVLLLFLGKTFYSIPPIDFLLLCGEHVSPVPQEGTYLVPVLVDGPPCDGVRAAEYVAIS